MTKRSGLLTVVFLLACGAGASTVHAEGGAAVLLLLENGVAKLETTLKAGSSEVVTLGGKTLTATGVDAALKGCENLGSSEKDTNSCKGVTVTFAGAKKGEVNCRSENTKGEKDAVGTVLAVADLRLATEETSSKALAPLLLLKVMGASREEELTINCGVVKNKIKGVLGCLLVPGLENIPTTTEVELTCKVNATTKDPATGTCTASCEWLKEHPLEANLGGTFEDSWMAVSARSTFNKDVFLDDCVECKEAKNAHLVFLPVPPIKYKLQEKLVESVLNNENVDALVEGVSLSSETWFKKISDKCSGKVLEAKEKNACSIEVEANPYAKPRAARVTVITSIGNASYEVTT